jgi:hypothetical protein
MAIVSTVVNVGHAQIDGRHYVEELHTDQLGSVHRAEYLAAADADTAEIAAARVEQIEAQLADSEFDEVLNGA